MDRHQEIAAMSPALADGDGSNARASGRSVPSASQVLVELLRLHRLLPARLRARWFQGPYWTGGDQLNAGWVPGTAVMVRREAVEQVGLLDESFFLYGEDLDWCWRMRRQGWRVGACNSVVARHRESQSSIHEFGADATRLRIVQSELNAVRRARGGTSAILYGAASAVATGVESVHPGRSPERRAIARDLHVAWRRAVLGPRRASTSPEAASTRGPQ
jgi:GT2 family glycosyltransferase